MAKAETRPNDAGWDDAVSTAVRALIDSGDREERAAACRELARLRGGQTFLEDATRDGSPHVRAAAVRALESFEEVDFDRWVLPAIGDRNPYVQQAALEVVRWRRLESALPEVLKVARRHPQRHVRGAALRALGVLGGAEAERILLAALNNPNEYLQEKAARALRDYASGPVQDAGTLILRLRAEVEQWLETPHHVRPLGVGKNLCRALAAVASADRQIVELLCRVLREGVGTRHAAAQALGQFRDEYAREPLEEAASDPSRALRIAVATALGALGVNESAAAVMQLLSDRDDEVVRAAIRAVACSGDHRFAVKLHDLAFGPLAFARVPALRCLAAVDPDGARALWLRCLSDTNPHVRRLAVANLSPHADDPSVADALAMAADGEQVEEVVDLLAVYRCARAEPAGRGCDSEGGRGHQRLPIAATWPLPDTQCAAYRAIYDYVHARLTALPRTATVDDLDTTARDALDELVNQVDQLRTHM